MTVQGPRGRLLFGKSHSSIRGKDGVVVSYPHEGQALFAREILKLCRRSARGVDMYLTGIPPPGTRSTLFRCSFTQKSAVSAWSCRLPPLFRAASLQMRRQIFCKQMFGERCEQDLPRSADGWSTDDAVFRFDWHINEANGQTFLCLFRTLPKYEFSAM